MLKPPALRPGDKIGVIAPASNIKLERLKEGAEELRRLGFEVEYIDSILEKDRYTAGSVERRVSELNQMLANPDIKAIISSRGGYGSMQILKYIDPEAVAAGPKIIMGYSDISALLIALYQQYSWVTFHGPMVAKDFAAGPSHYDQESFFNVLTKASPAGKINSTDTTVLHRGIARGRLTGGCLSLVNSLLATPWEIDTDDSILFLEDIDIKPYQLDRMITQLQLAGKFDKVRGIIFGEMAGCVQHPQQGYRLEEVLTDLTANIGVPVLYGLRSGHSEIGNITLPLGVEVTLDCDNQQLIIEEAAVI